ncbi:MAG: type II secretion system minor pseudopilin GspJ [Gammaproteobacteria bacterium]|nr:type II secretion system minor pseudopilin GspJ [Gammaproteobacteria bacterium]MBQ0775764.1 type II secretion system minor pseudopilin GspJ [Gammaproteobacteria bacterium]
MASLRRNAGFTLLEVLIAIAIFAGIFLAAQQMFSQAMSQRDQMEEAAGLMEQRQLMLTWLTMDLEQIIARPVRDPLGGVDNIPAVIGNAEFFSFTRMGWANPFGIRQRSELQRVDYRVVDNQLVRRYFPVLDPNQGTVPVETVLLNGVEDLQVRFLYQPAAGDYQWLDVWPDPSVASLPPLLQPLPSSIEVNVFLENGEVIHRFYRTVINPWI